MILRHYFHNHLAHLIQNDEKTRKKWKDGMRHNRKSNTKSRSHFNRFWDFQTKPVEKSNSLSFTSPREVRDGVIEVVSKSTSGIKIGHLRTESEEVARESVKVSHRVL